jgi:thymidylate synthase (FAD)
MDETTTQDKVKSDERYTLLHNHGFVGLVETMGSDQSIEKAARVSYAGNKEVRTQKETTALIRYLMRHRHTSPLEMGELVFHIKLPIFVMRQLVRHRTASLNELSGRYTELPWEFYEPDDNHIKPPDSNNKQGSAGEFTIIESARFLNSIKNGNEQAYDRYIKLLNPPSGLDQDGLSRESARMVLPVSIYTECYWKCDLKNFMGFLSLRCDDHAQLEIRDYAWAMYKLAIPHFPISFNAWKDYQYDSISFSAMEQNMLLDMIFTETAIEEATGSPVKSPSPSKRELQEFNDKLCKLHPHFKLLVSQLKKDETPLPTPMPNMEDVP